MSAGTITLTNNSAAVTGSGTAFTTELAAGDFIVVTVGGVPYTLPVKTVNSNTSLTLVSNYTGPTQSGAAWSAVPRVALNMVTAALVAQSAEALRGLNYDKQNWQSIFSGTGNVTVTLPDGSSFTGPAWNSFTTELNKKANSSDLGSAATRNTGTSGATVPLLNTVNTWSNRQTFSNGSIVMTGVNYPNVILSTINLDDGAIGKTVGFESTNTGTITFWRRDGNNGGTGATGISLPNQSGTVALTTSDKELKTIKGIVSDGYFERLSALEVVEYFWNEKSGASESLRDCLKRGFIAQQANTADASYAIPPASDDEFWGIDDRAILADLVLAVMDIKAKLEEKFSSGER